MAVLIDPPRWPAHGTRWSHLVSDTSLAELHACARRCGLPARSFDLDHYDVPVERYDDLVAAGAQPVSAHELIRRLRASGLRVPAVQRPRYTELTRRWHELLPGHPELGAQLLTRWSEPHRRYHDLSHLSDVLGRLDLLADGGEQVGRAVHLAAWFHDAVYAGDSPEEDSAELATRTLDGVLAAPEVAEVARLVRLTARHDPAPGDQAGQVLCDADLGILGADPQAYRSYTEQVRAEYRHVPEPDFRRGRAAILRRLLSHPRLFRTPTGRARWEAPARANLAAELARLAESA
ncbi:MAG TPA: DUF4031 domain-containing protein [Actinomycetaceae bacterium]|nr:DUF4031 domain-containing protein [Actinomycetaceae bacterium]